MKYGDELIMDTCPNCQGKNLSGKSFKIKHSGETVYFTECPNCGNIFDEKIKRPYNETMRKKHSAADIRFSENEKRNFISLLLEFLDTQNKILAAIATGTVTDDIEKICQRELKSQYEFKILLELDDLDEHADRS